MSAIANPSCDASAVEVFEYVYAGVPSVAALVSEFTHAESLTRIKRFCKVDRIVEGLKADQPAIIDEDNFSGSLQAFRGLSHFIDFNGEELAEVAKGW